VMDDLRVKARDAAGPAQLFKTIIIKYNAPIIFLILVITSSITSEYFLTVRNIFNVLLQQTPYLLVSLGVMLTIMTAGIDLSVGSVAGASGVLTAIVITSFGRDNTWMLLPAILCALAFGCLIGLINGILVSRMRMAPFIVTLAMMSIGQGIAFMMTNGAQIQLTSAFAAAKPLTWFATVRIAFGVPLAVVVIALIVLIFWFIMRFTSFGRFVLAVGSNEAATHLAGINVVKYKTLVYTISGGLASLAGIFVAGRTALGAPAIARDNDYALTAVAACVIGGVMLEGGKGTVGFTVIGVLILALITNIMNLLAIASYPQLVAKGVSIIIAIFLSKLGQNKA